MNTTPPVTRTAIVLPGLDGSNPLAFLAALGVLRAMTTARPHAATTLNWDASTYRPTLGMGDDTCDLATVARHCGSIFRHVLAGDFAPESYPSTTFGLTNKQLRELTRGWLTDARDLTRRNVAIPLLAAANVEFSDPSQAAAAFCELSFANGQSGMHLLGGKRSTKKGKLQAYEGLRDLASRTDLDDLVAEALDAWTYRTGFRSFRWCPTEFRPAAQQGDETVVASVPGANALAFLGLSFFPMVATASGPVSTAVIGREALVYPLWSAPLTADVVQCLLIHGRRFRDAAPRDRSAAGVVTVLSASRFVHEKGVYFTYAKAV